MISPPKLENTAKNQPEMKLTQKGRPLDFVYSRGQACGTPAMYRSGGPPRSGGTDRYIARGAGLAPVSKRPLKLASSEFRGCPSCRVPAGPPWSHGLGDPREAEGQTMWSRGSRRDSAARGSLWTHCEQKNQSGIKYILY